jgi:D-serine deaminase-like pyridoxal phosphate-dependent protein
LTPRAVLDLDVIERNAQAMTRRCARLGVRLRPHIKTHKVPALARLQTDGGAVTVSTLAEAEDFADAGFDDITWAMPIAPARREQALALAGRVRLGVLVDSLEGVEAARGMRTWLKVDCGYGRAGLAPSDPRAMVVASAIAPQDFAGVLTHAGHSYDCRSMDALREVARQEVDVTVGFAESLRRAGIAVPEVSIGSTPTLAVAETLPGVTEVRPGNYILLDLAQVEIGHCRRADIAVSVEATIISAHPERLVLDAGALALSKDKAFGHFGEVAGKGWPMVSLSQEHGIVRAPRGHGQRVGDTLRVLPAHSCLVGPLHGGFDLERGGVPAGRWELKTGW